MKKYNFNAGPSMLPREVIEKTAQQCLDFNGSGLSLMEISHRAKDFQPVVDEAVALVKELLDIPEGYSVIFLGGGASLEFCMIPYNFLIKKAAYLNTGVWAKKAMKEAKLFGEVVEVASSADANYTFIPKDWTVPADADYLHITTNNTIYGTEIRKDLDVPVRLIADMSSDIFSRPIDVKKYDALREVAFFFEKRFQPSRSQNASSAFARCSSDIASGKIAVAARSSTFSSFFNFSNVLPGLSPPRQANAAIFLFVSASLFSARNVRIGGANVLAHTGVPIMTVSYVSSKT